MSKPDFQVDAIDYHSGLDDLRKVRETVFVHEQAVPAEMEWDALDPVCDHVIARDNAGHPIGTGRLTADGSIGRMAVLREWRCRGVGGAMLLKLIERARQLRSREVTLHAQLPARRFYARRGFLPVGERFVEAGIDHQSMRLVVDAANPVESGDAAVAAMVGLLDRGRRGACIYSRDLDPGLLDARDVLDALRHLGIRGGEIRVLLQDPAAPQHALAPMIALSQRLPSALAFRAITEPVDRTYPSAYAANDSGGWYFRPLGHRLDGETRLDDPARARQLRSVFKTVWERARPCTEFRALGI